ncbi:MAG: hypothetical protein QM718_04125 [Steroidobacteraceae bacterium]
MTTLALILADFFAPPDPADPEARQALPELPALEQLLRPARLRTLPQGWRGWLQQRVVAPDSVAAASAAPARLAGVVAAAHVPEPTAAGRGYWLATPVSYVAGIDNLRLHPNGLLWLSNEEQQELARDFAGIFGADGLRLIATGERELLLEVPAEWGVPAAGDPARFLGREPAAGLPGGPDAAPLRRLGAELEMWLHQHPMNERRTAQGRLPLSGLWLWGGARRWQAMARSLPSLYGGDAFARSLWRASAQEPQPLPPGYLAWRALQPQPGDAVVVLPTLSESLMQDLAALERDWLAPVQQALRSGGITRLQLVAGSRAAELGPRAHWRFWRQPRRWWEALA